MQSFAGQTNHVANLLYAWRPFIAELWAAIYNRKDSKQGRVWIKQIAGTLRWIELFLNKRRGSLTSEKIHGLL